MNIEAISIPGPAGSLEALVHKPQSWVPANGSALLCHPHPQYGGNMHDGVLKTLADTLLAAGYQVTRFNFRGVGASEGRFDQGIGETQDVQTMLNALQTDPRLNPEQPALRPLLGGYSFGAAMAWQAATSSHHDTATVLEALWLVAPPLSVMPFADNSAALTLRIIVGAADDYCSAADAEQWLARQQQQSPSQAALQVVPGADHFFSGAQEALQQSANALLPPG